MNRWLLAVLFIIACSSPKEGILDFEFLDANGNKYRIKNLVEELEKENNYRYEEIKVVLVEAPSPRNRDFIKQQKYVDEAKHGLFEELGVMFVASSPQLGPYSGYHTSNETAKRLSGETEKFRVRIIGTGGTVLGTFTKPLSPGRIEEIIKKY